MEIPSFATGFARYAADSEAPELWKDLVGAWLPFLGPTGKTLYDLSGNGNHGTLTLMDPATDWVTGRNGWALDFDGDNDEVQCPNMITGNFWSFSAWIYPRSVSAVAEWGPTILGKSNAASDYPIWIFIENGVLNVHAFTDNAYGPDAVTGAILSANNWYHIAIAAENGSTVNIYVDGVLEGTGISAGDSPNANTHIKIGNHRVSGLEYDGLISEALLWDRALSAEEVAELYSNPYAMFAVPDIASLFVAAPPVGVVPQIQWLRMNTL